MAQATAAIHACCGKPRRLPSLTMRCALSICRWLSQATGAIFPAAAFLAAAAFFAAAAFWAAAASAAIWALLLMTPDVATAVAPVPGMTRAAAALEPEPPAPVVR